MRDEDGGRGGWREAAVIKATCAYSMGFIDRCHNNTSGASISVTDASRTGACREREKGKATALASPLPPSFSSLEPMDRSPASRQRRISHSTASELLLLPDDCPSPSHFCCLLLLLLHLSELQTVAAAATGVTHQWSSVDVRVSRTRLTAGGASRDMLAASPREKLLNFCQQDTTTTTITRQQ